MQPEGDYAKISVRDHGVGISPERLGNLFKKGETTYGTGGEEGSGLGLQLCADFANKIGGSVTVDSTLGEGSTFSVLVPLKKD
jgi:two-component system sensor histidine kinase/response regulator